MITICLMMIHKEIHYSRFQWEFSFFNSQCHCYLVFSVQQQEKMCCDLCLSVFSPFSVFVSGFSNSDQPSGADPHEDAVSETVVQGADWLHPLSSGNRRLAVSVEGFGAHALPGRALLSHVLVQLWKEQELAVWMVQHQRAHIYHYLHIRSGVWLCKCICITFLLWNCSAFTFSTWRWGCWLSPSKTWQKISQFITNLIINLVINTYFHVLQIASIVTLPFDVVKTRRQVELGELQAKNCNYVF